MVRPNFKGSPKTTNPRILGIDSFVSRTMAMLLVTIPLAGFAFIREGSPTFIPFDSHLLGLLFFIGPIATSACFVISAEYGRRIRTFSMSNFTLGVPLVGMLHL